MRFAGWLLLAWAAAGAGPARADGAWVSQLLRLPVPDRLELCGEAVPLDREDVAERLDQELLVALGSPVSTALWFKRAPRSFPAIEQELRQRALPDDLKYVALVESNLRAQAVSPAGAVGPWQFMPATGASYGLEQTAWRDSRRSWDESTTAALQHFADLHRRFGSWALALAAYNCGPDRVARSLEAQGQSDFYGLKLPLETERYVFRVLAAKLLTESPERYGIDLAGARLYEPEPTAEVVVEVKRRELAVGVLAAAAGVSYRRFLGLNPWVVGAALPRGEHVVRVPAENAPAFGPAVARWLQQNPEPRAVAYRVRKGDSLASIARRHGIEVGELCSWNGLTPKSVLRPNQNLVLYRAD